jgi:DNA-binding SARP family transcriptional activator/tetratricopeptide (TPR) repeat protein
MIQLQLLGAIDLRGADGASIDPILTRPKRLALLTYLAVARPRGFHRRDALLPLFWYELSEPRARASLSQALYVLRQGVGAESIATRGSDEVGVDPAHVWSDVAEMDAALEAGDAERALALYGGDLLPGFAIADAPDFERWLDGERRRLRAAATDAAWTLVGRAEAEGQVAAALRWARRAVALGPHDEAAVRRLLRLLDGAGDRAGAIDAYERYARTVYEELGTRPSTETQALIREIRGCTAAPPAEAALPAETAAPLEAAPPVAAAQGPSLRHHPAEHPSRRPARWPRRGAWLGALLAGLAVAALGLAPRTPAPTGRIAVLPFAVHGDTRYDYLRDGMVDLLATTIDGMGDVRAVDPRAVIRTVAAAPRGADPGPFAARALRADGYLAGSVVAVSGGLRIAAALHSADGEVQAHADVTLRSEAELFSAVDQLTRSLVAGTLTRGRERLAAVAVLTTDSLPALKAFLAGERALREGRFTHAAARFREATSADTTFALAWYRLSTALEWSAQPMGDAMARALRHAERLSPDDRRVVQARHAFLDGASARAEALYAEYLSRHPEDSDAWHDLGEVRFHSGPRRGQPLTRARASFAHVAALDPGNWNGRLHLARIEALEGRRAAAQGHLRAVLGGEPGNERALEARALLACLRAPGTVDHAVLDSVRRRLPGSENEVWMLAWRTAHFCGSAEYGRRLAGLLAEPGARPRFRLVAHTTSAHLEAARGDWAGVAAQLDSAAGHDAVYATYLRAALAAFLPMDAPATELQALRDRLAHPHRPLPAPISGEHDGIRTSRDSNAELLRLYLRGALAVVLGDEAGVAEGVGALEAWARSDAAESSTATFLLAHLSARRAAQAGRLREALALLESTDQGPAAGVNLNQDTYAGAAERLFRGGLLLRAGRPQEALRWFESIDQDPAFNLAYAVASYPGRAQALEALGRRREAARVRERLERWKGGGR